MGYSPYHYSIIIDKGFKKTKQVGVGYRYDGGGRLGRECGAGWYLPAWFASSLAAVASPCEWEWLEGHGEGGFPPPDISSRGSL